MKKIEFNKPSDPFDQETIYIFEENATSSSTPAEYQVAYQLEDCARKQLSVPAKIICHYLSCSVEQLKTTAFRDSDISNLSAFITQNLNLWEQISAPDFEPLYSPAAKIVARNDAFFSKAEVQKCLRDFCKVKINIEPLRLPVLAYRPAMALLNHTLERVENKELIDAYRKLGAHFFLLCYKDESKQVLLLRCISGNDDVALRPNGDTVIEIPSADDDNVPYSFDVMRPQIIRPLRAAAQFIESALLGKIQTLRGAFLKSLEDLRKAPANQKYAQALSNLALNFSEDTNTGLITAVEFSVRQTVALRNQNDAYRLELVRDQQALESARQKIQDLEEDPQDIDDDAASLLSMGGVSVVSHKTTRTDATTKTEGGTSVTVKLQGMLCAYALYAIQKISEATRDKSLKPEEKAEIYTLVVEILKVAHTKAAADEISPVIKLINDKCSNSDTSDVLRKKLNEVREKVNLSAAPLDKKDSDYNKNMYQVCKALVEKEKSGAGEQVFTDGMLFFQARYRLLKDDGGHKNSSRRQQQDVSEAAVASSAAPAPASS